MEISKGIAIDVQNQSRHTGGLNRSVQSTSCVATSSSAKRPTRHRSVRRTLVGLRVGILVGLCVRLVRRGVGEEEKLGIAETLG